MNARSAAAPTPRSSTRACREAGDSIRRRRRCTRCQKRFTTYETVELRLPQVVKTERHARRLRRRQAAHRLPARAAQAPGAHRATSTHAIERIVAAGAGARRARDRRRASIGEMVMQELYKLDKVAYIRFASVYRSFQDVVRLPRRAQGSRGAAAAPTRKARCATARPPMTVTATLDRAFMARALALAERGLYTTTPNPRVGCVIVARRRGDRRRLARSAPASRTPKSTRWPMPRARGARCARRDALRHARALQPPRPHAAVRRRADRRRRRARGRRDARSQSGGGARRRRACARPASPSTIGLLEDEARELNIGFVSRMTRGRPWVRMKIAASLDGRTALANGASQWITGEAARADGHRWRARACAILTGIGTVLQDDPRAHGARRRRRRGSRCA